MSEDEFVPEWIRLGAIHWEIMAAVPAMSWDTARELAVKLLELAHAKPEVRA